MMSNSVPRVLCNGGTPPLEALPDNSRPNTRAHPRILKGFSRALLVLPGVLRRQAASSK